MHNTEGAYLGIVYVFDIITLSIERYFGVSLNYKYIKYSRLPVPVTCAPLV